MNSDEKHVFKAEGDQSYAACAGTESDPCSNVDEIRSEASVCSSDRQQFHLNAESWSAFLSALDASPRDLPRLRRLLAEPTVFERPNTIKPQLAEDRS